MTYSSLLISLAVADRRKAHAFYQEALGLQAIGAVADDGVPEPLLFVLNDMTRLMLVPTGGFGWVIGDHQVAPAGTSECVIGIVAGTDAEVNEIVDRAGVRERTSPRNLRLSHGGTRQPSPILMAMCGP